MSDTNSVKPVCDLHGIKEAVCVHTDKVTDSCLAKDCIEDLRVYLTLESQRVLDQSTSAKARYVELMHVCIQVEAVPYNTGYYTAEITYYYRVLGEASNGCGRPVTISGLAVFTKRLILFGGESSAKTYYSRDCGCESRRQIENCGVPTVAVEVVDPIILGSGLCDVCSCCCPPETPQIPEAILACFDDELVLQGETKRLQVTIGQFSITRMQRSTQLLIPAFDYCIPTKSCTPSAVDAAQSPCELFSQIDFPIDAFFPTRENSCIPSDKSCTNYARTESKS